MSSCKKVLFFALLSVLSFAAFSGELLLHEIKILICYFITSSVSRILKGGGGGGRNFKKFEKNKDQNEKLFHPKSVQFCAQN